VQVILSDVCIGFEQLGVFYGRTHVVNRAGTYNCKSVKTQLCINKCIPNYNHQPVVVAPEDIFGSSATLKDGIRSKKSPACTLEYHHQKEEKKYAQREIFLQDLRWNQWTRRFNATVLKPLKCFFERKSHREIHFK
jgi:hypothetical protein